MKEIKKLIDIDTTIEEGKILFNAILCIKLLSAGETDMFEPGFVADKESVCKKFALPGGRIKKHEDINHDIIEGIMLCSASACICRILEAGSRFDEDITADEVTRQIFLSVKHVKRAERMKEAINEKLQEALNTNTKPEARIKTIHDIDMSGEEGRLLHAAIVLLGAISNKDVDAEDVFPDNASREDVISKLQHCLESTNAHGLYDLLNFINQMKEKKNSDRAKMN